MFFFISFIALVIQELCPIFNFVILYSYHLVDNISKELLKLGCFTPV